jgi:hypothetical protein
LLPLPLFPPPVPFPLPDALVAPLLPRPPPNAPPFDDPLLPSPLAVEPSPVPPTPLKAGSFTGSCAQPALPAASRQSCELAVPPSVSPAALITKADASNGAALSSFAFAGEPESLEYAVPACTAAPVSANHWPKLSTNEPACALPASKMSTAAAVALRVPANK